VNGTDPAFGNAGNGISITDLASGTSPGYSVSILNTIGGPAGSGNVIANNRGNGIWISGSNPDATSRNLVVGNDIGVIPGGTNAVPNGASGIAISQSAHNTIGGTGDAAKNFISGNSVYGIELDSGSADNHILHNVIGLAPDQTTPVGNGSDGAFLSQAIGNEIASNLIMGNQGNGMQLSDSSSNTIGGASIDAMNVISGNAINGIRIFGTASVGNRITGNNIGVGINGRNPVPNRGNGVWIDNAYSNIVGPGNVISGNQQSGILISSTLGSQVPGNMIVGNVIGADRNAMTPVPNSGDGVFISGSANNSIGGEAPGSGNTISGNAQSGILLFSPSDRPQSLSNQNRILGNLIGTDGSGTAALPNNADGVQILNSSSNTIGGTSSAARNVISGNLASGVAIDALATVGSAVTLNSTGNQLLGNYVGPGISGLSPLQRSMQQIGVLVNNSSGNMIGVPTGNPFSGTNVSQAPSNVISGNVFAGVDLTGTATGNAVSGNYIGVDRDGAVANGLGNAIGVLADNTIGNLIGGDQAGAGNIITASAVPGTPASSVGVQIQGPPGGTAGTLVLGNLIGIDRNEEPGANQVGVSIVNSVGNSIGGLTGDLIGGTASGIGLHRAGNIISGNAMAGVNIVGQLSLSNQILGNFIGTDTTGSNLVYGSGAMSSSALGQQIHNLQVQSPRDPNSYVVSPTQLNGVLINQASSNTVGPGNLISGNRIGVNIQGAAGDSTKGASNVVTSNKIGTDPGGMNPVPNFEYGVYISGSPSNSVSNNQISANGVAGIEIFGGGPQNATTAPFLRNSVSGNTIGGDVSGNTVFSTVSRNDMVQNHPVILIPTPDNPADPTQRNVPASDLPAYLGLQLHGVVVIGSAGNAIGQPGQGNTISGNVLTGIYITKHDFFGNTYAQPSNNTVQFNTIANNGMYGVYRYDAPEGSNMVVQSGPAANRLSGSPISIADFVTGVSNLAPPQPNPQSKLVPSGFGIPVNPFAQVTSSSGSGTKKGTRGGKHKPPHKVKHPNPKPTKHHVQRPVKHTTPRPARHPAKAHSAMVSRPRIPALMEPGKKLIQVSHPAIKRGK
jgi:hypothetical protein